MMTKRKRKNPHAVEMGRRGAKGRMKKLTAQQRSDLARAAVNKRWDRVRELRASRGPL